MSIFKEKMLTIVEKSAKVSLNKEKNLKIHGTL